MGQDRTRTRFVDATGGLNSNTEPWKVADNEYAVANNMLLEGDSLVSRDGSILITGDGNSAKITNHLHKSIAEYTFYDKLGVLTLCVVTTSDDGTNTLFHVYTRTSGASSFTSAGTITSAGVIATGVQKRDLLNFKNRLIICDGTNRPLEYNRNYSNTEITLLGIDGPNRKKYLCDFSNPSSADTIAFQPYTYPSGGNGNLQKFNAYTIDLPDISKSTDLYCLLLTGNTTSGNEQKHVNLFTNALNLNTFPDGTTSDANDYLCFTAYFENMLSMECLYVDVDTNLGTFEGEASKGYWRRMALTPAILNTNDWGGGIGNNNGRYFIKLTKQEFINSNEAESADWTAGGDTDHFNFSTVKAIRFVLKTITRDGGVSASVVAKAYIDLLTLEESPPIVSPSEKIIRSFDPYEAWSGGTYDYTKKTEGYSSLKVSISTAWATISSYTGSKDFGHWTGDEKISRSDFIGIDVYNDSTVEAALWLTVRFIDGSANRIGLTKVINNGKLPEASRLPIIGLLKPQTWTTIYMPLKFMMPTFWSGYKFEKRGEFEDTNHTATAFGNHDTTLTATTGTDAQIITAEDAAWDALVAIMSDVQTVQIGVKAVTGAHYLYFDKLRLCRQHLEKGICSFNGLDLNRYIDIPGIVEKVSNKYPLLGGALNVTTKIAGNLIHNALMLGEDWQIDGIQNTDDFFDYQIKTSLLSSLKLEIKGGDTATATLAFLTPVNLNNFGLDVDSHNFTKFKDKDGNTNDPGAYKFARFMKLITGDNYYFADGYESDANDYIEFDVMVSSISNLDFAYLIFQPSSSNTGDYYAYDLVTTSTNTLLGISKARNNKWMTLRVRKCDFKRYGSTDGINWGSITSVVIVIGTKGSDKVTVRVDNMNLKACGALKGDYYYKVLYRSEDTISRPSGASLVLPAMNVDAFLASIPVPTDLRVTHKDIYRIGGDNNQYKLVDTVGYDVTDYVDKKMDSELGSVLVDDNCEPPTAACMWQHRNRLWFGNTKSHTSRTLWSKSFNPCSFPIENYMDINPNIYGVVVGGISRGDDQIVFKSKAISKIVESGDRYWDVLIDESVGCSSIYSICSENGIVYWIYNKKAYRMDGDRVDRVFGHKVKNLFKYADSTAKAICHNGRILFAVKSTSSSTVNDVIISFNTTYGKWESVLIGEGYDVSDMFSSVIDNKIYSAKSSLVGTIPTYGYLYELFAYTVTNGITIPSITDNGSAIVAMVTPKYIPGYEKRVEGFQIFLTSIKAGANDVVMQPIIDYLKTNTVSDTIPLIDSVSPQITSIEVRGSDVTNFLGCEFSCATTTGVWKYLLSVFEYIVETDM